MRGPERSPWVGEQPVGSGNLPGAGPGTPIASGAAPERGRHPSLEGAVQEGQRSWGHLLPTEMDAERLGVSPAQSPCLEKRYRVRAVFRSAGDCPRICFLFCKMGSGISASQDCGQPS